MTRRATVVRSAEAAPVFSKAGFAYETLRRKILHGDYQPGERLRLTQIAHELQLSEMPVREALRLLQKEGLVVIHLHRGAEVARLSFQNGRDITEARMTLERAAAVAALPHHDAGSIADLERLLADLERAAGNPVKFALKNRALCTAMFAPCPNAFIRQLIDDLWDQVWQASSTSVFEVMPHRVGETIAENRLILAHLKAGDARRLQAAMGERMRNTIAAWSGVVERKPEPAALAKPRRQAPRSGGR